MSNSLVYKYLILNDDENVIKIVRQRSLQLFQSIIIPIILIILPFFFLYPLFNWGNKGIILFSSLVFIGLIWLIRNVVIWYLQIFIITDKRVVDIDQKGMFRKTVSDIPLTKVGDVFYQVNGIWQTIFRIGNIYLVLTDSKTKIEIKNIAQPSKTQQLVLQLKDDFLKQAKDTSSLSTKDLIELIEKIKLNIGEKKFNGILDQK
ncbi:MAG: hypothetical protein CMI53_04930 [Parcubacteria group bacterium]|nr:hypothetical protein [Parcubacteria group bacterium]|tara:strand:- start:5590 stop:6201 length:612 start_codon:yes stop_codon:yes gene_type:complete